MSILKCLSLSSSAALACGQSSNKTLAVSLPALLNTTQVRHRKAVSFRKYIQPNYRQKLLLATCEPVLPVDRRPEAEKCFNRNRPAPKPDHPYDVLLAQDLRQELANYPLVCFLHANTLTNPQRRLARNDFEHQGMLLRFYNRDIARLVMEGTRYQPLMHFVAGYHYVLLFANHLSDVPKIVKTLRKHSDLFLLGGLADQRRLLTVDGLLQASKLASLDVQRAMLVSTLATPSSRLLGSLNYYGSELAQLLDRHAPASSLSSSSSPEEASTGAPKKEQPSSPPQQPQENDSKE